MPEGISHNQIVSEYEYPNEDTTVTLVTMIPRSEMGHVGSIRKILKHRS